MDNQTNIIRETVEEGMLATVGYLARELTKPTEGTGYTSNGQPGKYKAPMPSAGPAAISAPPSEPLKTSGVPTLDILANPGFVEYVGKLAQARAAADARFVDVIRTIGEQLASGTQRHYPVEKVFDLTTKPPTLKYTVYKLG